MQKSWDSDKGGRDNWIAWMRGISSECLRVIKPGGHALVWALPRTSHWTGMAWEEAGWEPRDKISHVFGSGFPKSLDISKAIDKRYKENDEAITAKQELGKWLKECRGNRPQKDISKYFPSKTGGLTGCVANWELGFNLPTWDIWIKLKEILSLDDRFDYLIEGRPSNFIEAEREVIGKDGRTAKDSMFGIGIQSEWDITAPATTAAKQWAGFGTSLKPAHEDWWLFRKPLACKTIAENVLEWGCGGLNIDGSRIGTTTEIHSNGKRSMYGGNSLHETKTHNDLTEPRNYGRFPSNLIWSHSCLCTDAACHPSCPTWEFAKAGEGKSRMSMRGLAGRHDPGQGAEHNRIKPYSNSIRGHDDQGTPARFFKSCSYTPDDIPAFMYYAKASKSERGEGNNHPTVKSLSLMKYLVKLICPPNGLILDPFAGSGTTLLAAKSEGFHFVGIEREPEYVEIAKHRLSSIPSTIQTFSM